MVEGDLQERRLAIGIVGGGPSGLAALKMIMETPQYAAGLWQPTVFEERENIGGTWLPAVPDTDPPLTALYDSLTTNIPHPVMAFTDFPFPPSTPLYPKAAVVLSYLQSYHDHFGLSAHIRLKTTVLDICRDELHWKVQLSTGDTLNFDIVVIANGHYRVPRFPDTPGLADWRETGKATHSAWYRNPDKFAGKAILVVGGGPSGQDIAAEVCHTATRVFHSFPGGILQDIGKTGFRSRVVEFKEHGQVVFEDGTTEHGIDHCILATGYKFSYPFLRKDTIRQEMPPPCPPLHRELYNSTHHVFPLAMHIFPIQPDIPLGSLVFIGLLIRVVPFPLVEAQVRAAIKLFAHPKSLDLDAEMLAICDRYRTLQDRFGDDPLLIAKRWVHLPDGEQYDYRDRLHEFAEDDPDKRRIVPQWEKTMYERKSILRSIWRDIEAKGESAQWLQGVGVGGFQDWVNLTERMLCSKQEIPKLIR